MARAIGRSSRRSTERKPREKRWAELLEVATQVFYEKGYDAASLQDIADRIGMLKGSLYYYIQSKEDLLYEVISAVYADGLAVVTALAAEEGEPLARLENVVRGHVEHTLATIVPTTVFLHELQALPEERQQAILGEKHSYLGVFRQLIQEAVDNGDVRADVEPSVASLSILGSANWVYRWFRPDGRFTPELVASQIAEFSVRSIATESAQRRWRPSADAGPSSPRAGQGTPQRWDEREPPAVLGDGVPGE